MRPRSNNFIDELIKRQFHDNTTLPKKIVNNRLREAHNLYNKNFLGHYGCVNAIEFLNGGQFLASGGDDRRVLLWNVQDALQGIGKPVSMRAQHVSNIFCIGRDSKNTRLFSAGNDDQVIVHDIQTKDPLDVYMYQQAVYALSVDPFNDNVFATASDDGRILICDIRGSPDTDPYLLAKCPVSFNSVMYNPVEPRLIATASGYGATLWDVRKPHKSLLKYGQLQSTMSVRWNSAGTQLLVLRRRRPPVLYSVDSTVQMAEFHHPGYLNSCTMKSCCFAGLGDEYFLSGSDDFNLYMWKIPPPGTTCESIPSAHMVLVGHRSIVNQVRFNSDNCLIASSGVEKLIKVWSPFPLPSSNGGLSKSTTTIEKRKVFSHQEYVNLVMRNGQIITHDYSQEITTEDPRMMAFFDSLVQREMEGVDSETCQPPFLPPSQLSADSSSSSSIDSYLNSGDDSDDDDIVERNQNSRGESRSEDSAINNNNNNRGCTTLDGERNRKIVKKVFVNPNRKDVLKKLANVRFARRKGDYDCSSDDSNSTHSNTSDENESGTSPTVVGRSNGITYLSPSTSTSSNNSNNDHSSSGSSSSNEEDEVNKSSPSMNRLFKLRKRYSYFSSGDNTGGESSSKSTPNKSKCTNEVKNRLKRRKLSSDAVESHENGSTDINNSPYKSETNGNGLLGDDLNTGSSSTSSCTTPDSRITRDREIETRDSGVVLSDCASVGNSATSSNSKVSLNAPKYSHRNYRKRILQSDSD